MQILDLWVTQRSLKRVEQLPALMKAEFPPIEIVECDRPMVVNGHHRLMALWLSGQRVLRPEQYILIYQDNPRTNPLMTWKEFVCMMNLECE